MQSDVKGRERRLPFSDGLWAAAETAKSQSISFVFVNRQIGLPSDRHRKKREARSGGDAVDRKKRVRSFDDVPSASVS